MKIMKCKSELGLKVLPIFYNVKPSDVGELKEEFKQGLLITGPKNKVNSWRNALKGYELGRRAFEITTKHTGLRPSFFKPRLKKRGLRPNKAVFF